VNKKYAIGFVALMVCLVTASGAYAFGGLQENEAAKNALENKDFEAFKEAMTSGITEERFEQIAERFGSKTVIQQALEEGNYEAWVAEIESRPKITDKITEKNFEDFATMHKAKQEGNFETAQEIAKELGLDQFQHRFRNSPHFGKGKGIGPCNRLQKGIEDGS